MKISRKEFASYCRLVRHSEAPGHGLISIGDGVKGGRFSQRPAKYSSLSLVLHAGEPLAKASPRAPARGSWECQACM